MKKIILITTTALIFCTNVFSQKHIDHLQKAKRLKTTAWVLLGSGLAVTITGGFVVDNNSGRTNNYYGGYDNNYQAGAVAGVGLIVLGLAEMGTSIPFFIRSHREQKRAMAFSIKNENIQVFQKGRFSRQVYPALSLQINFGK
jgi:hypothetical protein